MFCMVIWYAKEVGVSIQSDLYSHPTLMIFRLLIRLSRKEVIDYSHS